MNCNELESAIVKIQMQIEEVKIKIEHEINPDELRKLWRYKKVLQHLQLWLLGKWESLGGIRESGAACASDGVHDGTGGGFLCGFAFEEARKVTLESRRA